MKNKNIKNILFVCTGNSCRSIMAEALLKKIISRTPQLKDKMLNIISAGVSPLEGISLPKETVEALKSRGIDSLNYKSKKITKNMVKEADLILVMDKFHKQTVGFMAEEKEKIYLLGEFCKDKNNFNIPDPIGSPLNVYKKSLELIEKCLEGLVNKLR